MNSKRTLLTGEIIGSKIEVIDSKNQSLKGLSGEVIDETKNTFKIKTIEGHTKNIIKDQVVIRLNDEKIDGSFLALRPEERTKKWLRKKIN